MNVFVLVFMRVALTSPSHYNHYLYNSVALVIPVWMAAGLQDPGKIRQLRNQRNPQVGLERKSATNLALVWPMFVQVTEICQNLFVPRDLLFP